MRSEGTGFTAGGGWGGGTMPSLKPRPIPQRRPIPPSPTRMRALSPAEQEAADARKEQLAQARKARARSGNHGQSGFSGLAQPQVQQIVELYKAGTSAKKVAEQVGCSRTTVLKYLELNNVEIRGGRESNRHLTPQIVELYATGLSMRDVGKQLGISNPTVRRYLIEAGVQTRNPGQRGI